MEQIIFGVGLLICGVMVICAQYLKEAIFFASAKQIVTMEHGITHYIGAALIIIAVVLVFVGWRKG
jgi:hypothetical protein